MKSVVIIGGGVSGLAAAYRLQQVAPECAVTLLEQRDRPGGTAWTLREEGFQLEIGPNGFLDTKPSTFEWCRDLGLSGELVTASATAARNRFLFWNGRLRPLPGGLLSFLGTPLLSWRAKFGLILERFRRAPSLPADESIHAFAQRRAGREVADLLADAIVTGIFAGDAKLLSLPACFPRLAALEREHGSVLKGLAQAAKERRKQAQASGQPYQRPGKMWSFPGGLRRLVEAAAGQLKKPPLCGVTARRLEKMGPRWFVHGAGAERWEADAVVLACPAHQQAALLCDVAPALAEMVAAIPYNRVAVVGLGYRSADVPQALDGFGYIAPQHTRRDVLGVQWCSSIFADRAPPGAVLLRAMCGGWQRAEMVGWDDERLSGAVRAELRLALGISAAPIFQRIIRWDRAIPQYHVGHLERVARIEQLAAQHPGLFLGGNAYHGVALNDCTEQGAVLAQRVSEFLMRSS